MRISGTIRLEGARGPTWIREEDGFISIYFFGLGSDEVGFELKPDCFKATMEAGREFLETGKMKDLEDQRYNTRGSSIILDADEEELSIEANCAGMEQDVPVSIDLSSKSGKVSLLCSMNQWAALRDCCQKILDANQAIKEAKKKMVVPIQAL